MGTRVVRCEEGGVGLPIIPRGEREVRGEGGEGRGWRGEREERGEGGEGSGRRGEG